MTTLPPGIRLFETMRAVGGEVALWPLHRDRLVASARAFGVPLPSGAADDALHARLKALKAPARIRLSVGRTGDVRVEVAEMAPPPSTAWIDPEPFASLGTQYCVHKTTWRDHYDERTTRALAHGADEAILLTADGHVGEGTRTTVWIERDGRFLTPPLSAGGLPGVMRAYLLETRDDTAEASLTADDLVAADTVWLSNAVVGLVPISLVS